MVLGKEAEEMAYHWAMKLNTDYVHDPVFQKNFYKDWIKTVPDGIKNLFEHHTFPNDFDFSEIQKDIERKREEKKNRSKEEKKAEKEEKAQLKEKYGFAILNGEHVQLGNYIVEPPGLFMGRGKHPLRGRWKSRIYPEDVTINLSKKAEIPQPVYPNENSHSWKEVVENKNALWTAKWYCKLTGGMKRVLFAASSPVKQEADKNKFEKAINLANNFDEVIAYIDQHLDDVDNFTRQVATVSKIIATLAIRVGDEKDWDSADTFGATTLLKKHITINQSSNEITFDFLGKDSVPYHNKSVFPQSVVNNMMEYIKDKQPNDRIFTVEPYNVNEFLGTILEGLTAKQFRTAIGSKLLAEKLRQQKIDSKLSVPKKLEYYTEANLEVALKLNHQRAVTDAYDKSLNNMKERLKDYKQQLKGKKKEKEEALKEALESKRERVKYAKQKKKGTKQKESIQRANTSYKKKKMTWERRVANMQKRIENLESKIAIKEKTRGVALGTSKTNYADPRIPISWCKDNDVEIKRIFPKTMQEKFEWAVDVSKNFYKKYPDV